MSAAPLATGGAGGGAGGNTGSTGGTAHEIDPSFLAAPRADWPTPPSSGAASWGSSTPTCATNATAAEHFSVRDGALEGTGDDEDTGLAVRVVHDGTWGFAAGVKLTPEAAVRLAEQAVAVATVSKPLAAERVELADEPVHGDVSWVSAYDIDPFTVPAADKVALLTDWSRRLLADARVDHTDASLMHVQENTFYADLAGTITTQQRMRLSAARHGGRRGPHHGDVRDDADHGRPRSGAAGSG